MPSPALDPLVARARQGDQVALAEYLRHLEPRLVRMVELRFDRSLRRRLDPADVVQDAWLEVVRRFDEWRGQDELPLHVWVRLITGQSLAAAQRRHLATHMRDALREGSAPNGRPSMSSDGVADAFVASATSPSQAVAREELRQRVRAAIEGLDEIDREIVAMRHFENLSNEDTAAELGIEPSAASMRFMRALVRLRPELKALGLGGVGAGA
ncbi:MAG: sigma-70 family RNA polymerase sigma factor [Planctomycetes bacterium]|nr:sigma-70 family RNA polymerase sigma factor [Planctomycetota bacterium]